MFAVDRCIKNRFGRVVTALWCAVSMGVFFASPAFSAEYEIDTSHALIEFSVPHLVVSNTKGVFNDYTGVIKYDPENVEASVFSGTIQVNSIDTRNKKRDDHLKSNDFFSAKKYPVITFKSTDVKKTDSPNVVSVTGDFTIKGVTKSVTFPLTITDPIKNPWGKTVRGFSTSFKINRMDYGLTWNKVLEAGGVAVGETVTIMLDLEGIQK